MKINVAILDGDSNYLNKLVAAITARYADKVETYSFTDAAMAQRQLEDLHVHIFLANPDTMWEPAELPDGIRFAYLVDAQNVRNFKG